MRRRVVRALFLVLIGCAVLGLLYRDIVMASMTRNPIPPSAQSITQGRALFHQNCEACHGVEGRGDGPVAASLALRPEDLTSIWPSPYFPDGMLAYRILNDGKVMPAWKSVISTMDVWHLVNFIRAQHH